MEGKLTNSRVEIVDVNRRIASWVKSLDDLDIDSHCYPDSDGQLMSQKPEESLTDEDATPSYSTSYTRTKSCNSRTEYTEDGNSSEPENDKFSLRSSGMAHLQVWPSSQTAAKTIASATRKCQNNPPFSKLSETTDRASFLPSCKDKNPQMVYITKDKQKLQAPVREQDHQGTISSRQTQTLQQETLIECKLKEVEDQLPVRDTDSQIKAGYLVKDAPPFSTDSFPGWAKKRETKRYSSVNKAETSKNGPSSSRVCSIVGEQETDFIKMQDRHQQMEGSSLITPRHKEVRHGSFSYKDRALTGRLNSLPANAGSLVAIRVKQFEEMIHSEMQQSIQPSQTSQKRRSDVITDEAGEQPASLEDCKDGIVEFHIEMATESERKEPIVMMIEKNHADIHSTAPIHGSKEHKEQSHFPFPKPTNHRRAQQQPPNYFSTQHSQRPSRTTDRSRALVRLQRGTATVKQKSGRKKKPPQQAVRKSEGWWACTCKLRRYCCCTCYTEEL